MAAFERRYLYCHFSAFWGKWQWECSGNPLVFYEKICQLSEKHNYEQKTLPAKKKWKRLMGSARRYLKLDKLLDIFCKIQHNKRSINGYEIKSFSFERINIPIGPNNAGKSNFIRALSFSANRLYQGGKDASSGFI